MTRKGLAQPLNVTAALECPAFRTKVVFPSYMAHSVYPVSKGVRQAVNLFRKRCLRLDQPVAGFYRVGQNKF